MSDAQQLLRQYQQDRSPPAFEMLIRRHYALVYSSALRQVRDRHLAEDVSQAVFLIFAQKAQSIRSTRAVGGWLLSVTRRAAIDALRKQAATERQERAVARPQAYDDSPSAAWNEIRSVVDDALNDLFVMDRDALVLRFFENRSIADVGRALRTTEDAARKRVDRALARLRDLLCQRGLDRTPDALSMLLVTHDVLPLPPGVAVPSAAATFTPGSQSIAQGVSRTMTYFKILRLTAVISVIAGVAGMGLFMLSAKAQLTKPATSTFKPPPGSIVIDPATTRPSPSWPHFHYAGNIVDEDGNPRANVEVFVSTQLARGGRGSIESVKTDAAGEFHIDRQIALYGENYDMAQRYAQRMSFDHPDFVYTQLDDLRQLSRETLDHLHITLRRGGTFQGRAIDADGKPIANAIALATYGKTGSIYQRGGNSDAAGRFTIKGLPDDDTLIHVIANSKPPLMSGQMKISSTATSHSVPQNAAGQPIPASEPVASSSAITSIVLKEVRPASEHVHHILGMTVADVDAALADELLLYAPNGMLILEPGPNAGRLNFTDFGVGDQVWLVGPDKITDTADAVRHLIAGCVANPPNDENPPFRVNVWWNCDRTGGSHSHGDWLSLSQFDLEELRRYKPAKSPPIEHSRGDDSE